MKSSYCSVQWACLWRHRIVLYSGHVHDVILLFCTVGVSMTSSYCSVQWACLWRHNIVLYSGRVYDVILLFCTVGVFMTSVKAGRIVRWIPSTNFDSPLNWNTGQIPCHNQRVRFPNTAPSVYIQHNLTTLELVYTFYKYYFEIVVNYLCLFR